MARYNVFYFSYGSNLYPEMIKAIICRKPNGFKYELKGYELCLQNWNEIPKKARKVLKRFWDKSFKSYILVKSPKKSVNGIIWKISKEEHELIGQWELHGLWYTPITLKRKIGNKNVILKTEIFKGKKAAPVKNKKGHPPFPVKKEKILYVANITREEYLSEKIKELILKDN